MLDLTTPSGMQTLADWVHRLIGSRVIALAAFIIVLFHLSAWWLVAVFGADAAVFAYKEFKWDLDNETPATSGGIPGGWLDFYGYLEGSGVDLVFSFGMIWAFRGIV